MQRIRHHLSFANVISMVALFVALGGASYAAVTLPKNSVGAAQIKKNAVRAAEVRKNAVGASEIKRSAVATGDVKDNSLTGGDVLDGSLGTADLADGSVNSAKIGDGSVALSDLAPDASGPRAFARVRADGTLETEGDGQTPPLPSQNRGVDQADIQKNAGAPAAESTGPGVYCFGGLDFTPRSAVVTLDNSDSLPAVPAVTGGSTNLTTSVALFKGPDLGRCDAAHGQLRVALTRVNDTAAPELVDHGFTIWIYG